MVRNKHYCAVANWKGLKWIRLFSDSALLVASGYLMIKKLSDFSISGWLLNNAFHQPMVTTYVILSGCLLVFALFFKLVTIIFDLFPPQQNHNFIEPDELSNCLYRINAEINEHLNKIGAGPWLIKTLCNQHTFEQNLALIVKSMAEHIGKSIPDIKSSSKDVFISLYRYDSLNRTLVYLLHFDPKKDLVESRVIQADAPRHSDYECVKCIRSERSHAYILDKGKYAKGASRRYKTIEHYIGCKLASDQTIFGFLNIEFHNAAIFKDEDEMMDFMEQHIYPFKLLLEYQFLKRDFFHSFQSFEQHWRLE